MLAVVGCGEPTGPVSLPVDSTPTPAPTTPEPTTPPTEGVVQVTGTLHPLYGTMIRVRWHQSGSGRTRVEVDADGESWETPARDVAPGWHEEWVFAPYDTDVDFVVVQDTFAGAIRSAPGRVRTAPFPADLPRAVVTVDDRAGQQPSAPYLFTSVTVEDGSIGSNWWVQILDRSGRPLWAFRTPDSHTTMHTHVSRDGRSVLLDRNSWWGSFDQGLKSRVERVTLDGEVIETWATPGLHHAFAELPDGHLIYGAYRGRGYDEEELMDQAPDRTERAILSCRDWLLRRGFGGSSCGSNTITWHEPTQHLLWSMFTFDTVLDVDRATGDVARTFGQLPGSYAFDPTEAQLWYAHGAAITPEGTLLASTHDAEDGTEIVAREFAIDDASRTLSLVWDFGVGDGLWGQQMGEVHRLAGGNTLHNAGTQARVREARPDRTVVWDVEWIDCKVGRSVFVDDLYALVGVRP